MKVVGSSYTRYTTCTYFLQNYLDQYFTRSIFTSQEQGLNLLPVKNIWEDKNGRT